mmetsp:Transcript_20180/g.41121  ORF Transcript_20180/g.41121 Transcript_20180/m.41121 type:complete len:148 (+) Transcript_20180:223-666(+)
MGGGNLAAQIRSRALKGWNEVMVKVIPGVFLLNVFRILRFTAWLVCLVQCMRKEYCRCTQGNQCVWETMWHGIGLGGGGEELLFFVAEQIHWRSKPFRAAKIKVIRLNACSMFSNSSPSGLYALCAWLVRRNGECLWREWRERDVVE